MFSNQELKALTSIQAAPENILLVFLRITVINASLSFFLVRQLLLELPHKTQHLPEGFTRATKLLGFRISNSNYFSGFFLTTSN